MKPKEFTYCYDDDKRRWACGKGGSIPMNAQALLALAGEKTRRWSSAGKLAGKGFDQVDAEKLLINLTMAGLVEIHERYNRRGDWEPYEWRLTEAGHSYVQQQAFEVEGIDVKAWLSNAKESPIDNPIVEAICDWLSEGVGQEAPTLVQLVIAIADELLADKTPHARTLPILCGGHSKSFRVRDWSARIEDITGVPLEEIVRLHGQSTLLYGPFSFGIEGRAIDGLWSKPWIAMTENTVWNLSNFQTNAKKLITIENLMPFEETVRRGLPEDTIALFTGGFPRRLEQKMIKIVCAAGISEISHWSDLDLGGLRILRHMQKISPVAVTPWRMEPEILEKHPTRPLTERDRKGLKQWVEDTGNPCIELAKRMLEKNAKLEQESWYL